MGARGPTCRKSITNHFAQLSQSLENGKKLESRPHLRNHGAAGCLCVKERGRRSDAGLLQNRSTECLPRLVARTSCSSGHPLTECSQAWSWQGPQVPRAARAVSLGRIPRSLALPFIVPLKAPELDARYTSLTVTVPTNIVQNSYQSTLPSLSWLYQNGPAPTHSSSSSSSPSSSTSLLVSAES